MTANDTNFQIGINFYPLVKQVLCPISPVLRPVLRPMSYVLCPYWTMSEIILSKLE